MNTAGLFRSTRLEPEGPRVLTTLLLIDQDDPRQLTSLRNRRLGRIVARFFASSIDQKLAQGISPESNRLLAARAQMLVSPGMRRSLARSWENLLEQARRPVVARHHRVPINRSSVVTSEPEIREMIDFLLAPLPVPARGTALAISLLVDGTGPVYDPRRSAELVHALREAITQLDPATAL